jgi:hypothetical protein
MTSPSPPASPPASLHASPPLYTLPHNEEARALIRRWAESPEAWPPPERAGWRLDPHPLTDEPLAPPLRWEQLRAAGEGKMLGLLLCETPEGERGLLRAFSGQLAGAWVRAGWAPPLFELARFAAASWRTQLALHALTEALTEPHLSAEARATLKGARREVSRALTREIHEAYTLTTRGGERRSLYALWPEAPTGTGECCAPKLLCRAHALGWRPLGLAEVWWGAPQGRFEAGGLYAPCEERCAPLWGWLS